MSDLDELTPKHGINQWDLVFTKLGEMKQLCKDSYEIAEDTRSLVRGVIPRVEYLEKKSNARDINTIYAPLLWNAINTLGLIYLAFRFGHG